MAVSADAFAELKDYTEDKEYSDELLHLGKYKPTLRGFSKPPESTWDAEHFAQKHASSVDVVVATPLGRHFLAEAVSGAEREEVATRAKFYADCSAFCASAGLTVHDALVLSARYSPDLDGALKLEEDGDGFDVESAKEAIRTAIGGAVHDVLGKALTALQNKPDLLDMFLKYKWYALQPIDPAHFTRFRCVGRGAFGSVFGGIVQNLGFLTAAKVMSKKLVAGKHAGGVVQAERAAMVLLGEHPSPFVLHLIYAFETSTEYCLVMDLAIGGDLAFHLHNEDAFAMKRAKHYAAEIALGLHHMHTLDILYRDLKPENVLLDSRGRCKISDFGLVKMIPGLLKNNKKTSGRAGTPGYWAPEIVLGKKYGVAADWWSFGCVVFAMITGRSPFSKTISGMENRDDATLKWEIQCPKSLPGLTTSKGNKLFSGGSEDLCLQLLDRSPKKRLTFDLGLIYHKFFSKTKWVNVASCKTKTPWTPEKGKLYVLPRDLIEKKNKDADHDGVELKPSVGDDSTANEFAYSNPRIHERDIVEIIQMESRGELERLKLPHIDGKSGSSGGDGDSKACMMQ